MNLLEAYRDKLSISEKAFASENPNEIFTDAKKLAIATVYRNTEKFLTEAYANSVGTQRSAMGDKLVALR